MDVGRIWLDFFVGFGRILDGFLDGFGWILGGFGRILDRFGWILDRLLMDFGLISDGFS